MNLLITGCAGFIGSHLTEFFIRRDHAVVGVDNMNAFYDPDVKRQNLLEIEKCAQGSHGKFVFYHTDIRHQDQISQIYRAHKTQAVIHLAAMAGVRPSLENPLLYVDVNERGTATLLEEAKNAGVQNFIFCSSSAVYGNNKKVPFAESDPVDHPISPYAATKKAGELICHVYHNTFGMSVACLRLFTVYGPRQRPDLAISKFTRLILDDRKVPIYGDGTKSRDFTYVDDIVLGIDKALTWMSGQPRPVYDIFNLGESQTTSVNELADLLKKALNKPVDRQYLPDQPGDVLTTFADISKAKKILGYNPRIKIEEGVKKYIDWVLR